MFEGGKKELLEIIKDACVLALTQLQRLTSKRYVICTMMIIPQKATKLPQYGSTTSNVVML